MQRRKGATAERELAKELVRLFAEHGLEADARRTAPLQAGAVRGLVADLSAADVTCTLLPDDHVEAKRCETLAMAAWCAQAERDSGGKRWLVAWRQNRQPWRVTMPLRHLVKFYGWGDPPVTAASSLVTLTLADFVAVRAAQRGDG